ncbi:hypothetical protein [Candidatus Uabimicrobium sp. HlEnr_7]|uniref:hypothetical protein n=1 Tax=Candidatus Uabimicrobium helgolandensis TaxID=3095367 RepID=UPI003559228F
MRFLVASFFCIMLVYAQDSEKISIRYKVAPEDTQVREKMVAHLAKYLKVTQGQKIPWLRNLASLATYTNNSDNTVTAEITYKVLFENFNTLYNESFALQNKIAEVVKAKELLKKEASVQEQLVSEHEKSLVKERVTTKELQKQLESQQKLVLQKNDLLSMSETKCDEIMASSAEIIKNKHNELLAHKEQIAQLQKQIVTINKLDTDKNKKIEELEKKLKSNKANIKILEEKNGIDLVKTKELQLIKAQKKIESLQEQVQSWSSRYKKQQKALYEFSQKIIHTKQHLAKIEYLSKRNAQTQKKIDLLVLSHNELKKKMQSDKHQKEVKFLREQNDKILQVLFSTNNQFKKMTIQNQSLQKNIAQKKIELNTNKEQLAQITKRVRHMQENANVLRKKYMDLYKKYWQQQSQQNNKTLQYIVDRQDLLLKEFKKLKDEIYFLFDEE